MRSLNRDSDRLAEGIMSTYKSRGAKILLARTMQESGTPFNYVVAAFEEPDKQRYELSFVKMALLFWSCITLELAGDSNRYAVS